MSITDINNAAQSLTEAAEAYHGKIADIDARVAVKEAAVDAFIAGAMSQIILPRRGTFNRLTSHNKTSIEPDEDPADLSRSTWTIVPLEPSSMRISGDESKRAVLSLSRAYSSPPGFYENPQYSNDVSRTMLNFVLASAEYTSEGINERIAALGLNLKNWSNSSSITETFDVPIIRGNMSGFMKLWVRFNNISAIGAAASDQSVLTFGGNTTFQLDEINIY